jgi:hypothetical protein
MAEAGDYVLERYEGSIRYYQTASARNKRWYLWSRYLTIVFGALVTLVAALSSADFVQASAPSKLAFAIATPVLAALLTILGGFAQNFQWGASWREMMLTAERLERERDRIRVTERGSRSDEEDIALLNDLVISESQSFFDRILGRTQLTASPTKDG